MSTVPPTSQNGFSANDRSVIHSATIPGTDVNVAVRTGSAGDLLLYAAARWHREVEPLRAPDGVLDCWGYAERPIRGSTTELSNHASGTALDLRARAHPLGTNPAGNFTPAQITAIHRIIADCSGALRWGGDYVGRKDGMHIEVIASEVRCRAVLERLQEDDMPLTDADLNAIADRVWTKLRDNSFGDKVGPIQVLNGVEKRLSEVQKQVDALKDK